jgi:predicted nucleic acid-binding protein
MAGFGVTAEAEQIKSARDKKGRPMTFADAWIASAALQANVPLVTNNTRDFEAVDGLVVLSAPRPV